MIPLANARLMARRIPDAQLHVVRGGGHLFLLDEPESAVGEIQSFLGFAEEWSYRNSSAGPSR